MTREEAIEVMKAYRDKLINSASNQLDGDIEALDMAIKALEQEPKTLHWIPVSEMLPEDGQNVLFCDIDNDIMVGYHVKDRHNTHFSQDGTYEDMKNVWAWMPLPKPYEPQERSGEE